MRAGGRCTINQSIAVQPLLSRVHHTRLLGAMGSSALLLRSGWPCTKWCLWPPGCSVPPSSAPPTPAAAW